MLIKVFGIWLMAANIQYLSPDVASSSSDDANQSRCFIKYADNGTMLLRVDGHSCDEVAAEINRQAKGE